MTLFSKALLSIVLALIGAHFLGPTAGAQELLKPELAFQFSAQTSQSSTGAAQVTVHFNIAEGYYMYEKRFAFTAREPEVVLGIPQYPQAIVINDPTFGPDIKTFRKSVEVIIPIEKFSGTHFTIAVTSQGCADIGVCYPPMKSQATLTLPQKKNALTNKAATDANASNEVKNVSANFFSFDAALSSQNIGWIVSVFFILGLGLSLTPCVLPMLPILSALILGEEQRAKGGVLSLAYSAGVVLVYSLLGMAAGALGVGLSAFLQNPFVLIAFASLMILLGAALWRGADIQVPEFIQRRVNSLLSRQKGGSLKGAFIVGGLSALIVGPCVAPPLAGVLLYISQTQRIDLGGLALAVMALGMCVPLIVLGFSAKRVLPKSGPWMLVVKQIFALLLFALAIWLLAPVLGPRWQMGLLSALAIGGGGYFIVQKTWILALILLTLGSIQGIGAVHNAVGPLAPFSQALSFTRVHHLAELTTQQTQAGWKILDFYADWCVSCKEMEAYTFTDSRVQAALNNVVRLQADVTANTEDDQALLKNFNLYGPPAIIFFAPDGHEVGRVIGYQNADTFIQSIKKFGVQS